MRIVPAYQSLLFAPVTGTVDATYINTWLTNGLPGFPGKTTGAMSLTATPAAAINVDVIAVLNHKINQAATIAITGGVSTTIPTAAWPWDGIPVGWCRVLPAPVSVSSLVLGVTGNTDPVIVGEFYAGQSIVFPDILQGRKFAPDEPFSWEGEFSSLAPFDIGVAAQRRVSGRLILSESEHASLVNAFLSQRRGNRPILWVEDDNVNDAWLAQFHFESDHSEGYHFVDIEITEIPRTSW